MPTHSERRFRVTDCLLLIAATAVGLGMSRAILSPEMTLPRVWESASKGLQGGWSLLFLAQLTAELMTVSLIPSLGAWTLGCLVLRLMRPRPPWRRCSRQPGGMACLIAMAAVAVSTALSVTARGLSSERYDDEAWLGWQIMIGSIAVGVAIFWCWATLLLSGRWRSEPSWVDRLGRLLGGLWLVVTLIYAYANLSTFYL